MPLGVLSLGVLLPFEVLLPLGVLLPFEVLLPLGVLSLGVVLLPFKVLLPLGVLSLGVVLLSCGVVPDMLVPPIVPLKTIFRRLSAICALRWTAVFLRLLGPKELGRRRLA